MLKFKDLHSLAQIQAITEYIEGWQETHPDETSLTSTDVYRILNDNEGDLYTEHGEYLGEP